MAKHKTTSEELGIDIEKAYKRKTEEGVGWVELAKENGIGKDKMRQLMFEYCQENGKGYPIKGGVTNPYGLIIDAKLVDRGKVMALRRGHWTVKQIADDCGCIQDVVRQILREEEENDKRNV